MKKIMMAAVVTVCLVACSETNEKNKGGDSTANQSAAAQPEETSAGITLIAQSDCLGCHKVEEKLIGPAYAEVAKRYGNSDSTVAMLAEKIIKGGAGSWGEVPMAAHPSISEADAKEMAKYILSIK